MKRSWLRKRWAALVVLAMAWAAQPSAAELGAEATAPEPLYGDVWFLCIGVNEQARPDYFDPLPFANRDAQAMHQLFAERFGYDQGRLLLGRDATKERIEAELHGLIEEADQDDAIIVFYAGHGHSIVPSGKDEHERRGYLVPYDLNADPYASDPAGLVALQQQLVDMATFTSRLMNCEARHVLLILDCCFSGFAADIPYQARGGGGKRAAEVRVLLSEPTRQVLTAGTDEQKSFEETSIKHGIFTWHLIQELEAADIRSVHELFSAVRGPVINAAADRNAQLTPQLRNVRPSHGDWVFLTPEQIAAVQDAEVETRLAYASAPPTTTEELDAFRSRSASVQKQRPVEDDPEWVAQRQIYESRAAAGDELAMVALAHCYERGIGTQKDPERAFFWASEAFAYDDPQSKAGAKTLADYYRKGVGVQPNPTAADEVAEVAQFTKAIAGMLGSVDADTAEDVEEAGQVLEFGAQLLGLLAERDATIAEQVNQLSSLRDELTVELRPGVPDWNAVQKRLVEWQDGVRLLRQRVKTMTIEATLTPEQAASLDAVCNDLAADLRGLNTARQHQARGLMTKRLADAGRRIDDLQSAAATTTASSSSAP